MSSCFSLSVLAQATWTGSASNNWATAGNWTPNSIPNSTNNVVIPAGKPRYPTIGTGTLATARSVEVESGASLTIASSGTLTINGSRTINSANTTSFYNAGTVNNNGQLIVGDQVSIRFYGLQNVGVFNNNTGAQIKLDRSSNTSLYNPSSGTFTNSAIITIGASGSTGTNGLKNDGTFANTTGAKIIIDNSGTNGLINELGSTFGNAATITIGASATIGTNGLQNRGTFQNNTGGQIQLDRSTTNGMLTGTGSTFTNSATITIGASAPVGSYGLQNIGTFRNNGGGQISLDRATDIALNNPNSGTFINAATITIGALALVGDNGLFNSGIFNNNTGGRIKVDNSVDIGFLNAANGTFANSATITIGASATVGNYGLQNRGTFTNNTGGQIQIDRATNTGLFCTSVASFTNSSTITIGASVSAGLYGFWSNGIFDNNAGGLIKVDNSADIGFVNGTSGTFTNAATIVVGALTAVGRYGLENKGGFANNAGGRIQIDRATTNGLITDPGSTFTNSSTITIGASATVGTYGVINIGTFSNNTGGQIQLDRSAEAGLFNPGSFTNSANISIGASASVGRYGLLNSFIFNNNPTGKINIDNSTDIGLLNVETSTFTNSATITIGAIAPVGPTGVLNYTVATFNNTGCAALLNIVANAIIENANVFSNSGTIIENANGNSAISVNSGVILNRNGGTFTVTSGAQPLSLTTVTPTNCSAPVNGAITLSGLQASTTYTLSYNTGLTTTTVNPNPVSNANGEVTITGLGAGTYTLSLGGSCVPLALPLSATIDGPLTPTLNLGTIPAICVGTTSLVVSYTATTGSPNAYSLLGAGITPVSGGALAAAPASVTVNLSSPAVSPSLDFTLLVSNTITGCVSASSIPVSVIVNALPNASLSASSLTFACGSGNVTLTATPTGASNYQFFGPIGMPTSLNQNSASNSAIATQPGLYTLTVTTGICSATTSLSLTGTAGTIPNALLLGTGNLSCDSPTLSLTALGGSSYSFSGPVGGPTGVVEQSDGRTRIIVGDYILFRRPIPTLGTAIVNKPGTYTVLVTGENNCFATATILVTGTECIR